jgi:hypothetical protein
MKAWLEICDRCLTVMTSITEMALCALIIPLEQKEHEELCLLGCYAVWLL